MGVTKNQQPREFVLDVGGEGRHPQAWNLNPSPVKTLGNQRGQPIPRHLYARADAIPLADRSVDRLIVERTPLRAAACRDIARVIASPGVVVLRHVRSPIGDPHGLAKQIILGRVSQRDITLGNRIVQETVIRVAPAESEKPTRSFTSAERD